MSRFAEAAARLEKKKSEWTIDAMNGCLAVCHHDSRCETCNRFVKHLSEAAGEAAILLDHFTVKEAVFKAFPKLETDYYNLKDDLHEVGRDYRSAAHELEFATRTISDLEERISKLETQLANHRRDAQMAMSSQKRRRDNSPETRRHPIPVDEEEEEEDEYGEYDDGDFDNDLSRGGAAYSPSRPPSGQVPYDPTATAAVSGSASIYSFYFDPNTPAKDLTSNFWKKNQPWPFYYPQFDPTVGDGTSLVPNAPDPLAWYNLCYLGDDRFVEIGKRLWVTTPVFTSQEDRGVHSRIKYAWRMWDKLGQIRNRGKLGGATPQSDSVFTFDGEIVHSEVKQMLEHWCRDPAQIPPYVRIKTNGSLDGEDLEVIAWLRRVAKDRVIRFRFMDIAAEVCCEPQLSSWNEVLGSKANIQTAFPSATLMDGYKRAFTAKSVSDVTKADVIKSMHLNGATTTRVLGLIGPLLARYASRELNNYIARDWRQKYMSNHPRKRARTTPTKPVSSVAGSKSQPVGPSSVAETSNTPETFSAVVVKASSTEAPVDCSMIDNDLLEPPEEVFYHHMDLDYSQP